MNPWLPRERTQWAALVTGVLALVACLLLGLFVSAQQTLLSYLFAFLFFTGLSVGSLALLMVHVLTGGAWGYYIRPALLAAARALPLMALLAIPVLAGMHVLYPWAQASELTHDALLRKQTWYLDPTFFVIRTVGYFVIWIGFMAVVGRWVGNPDRVRVLPRIAAPGLILYGGLTLLASTDWTMSLTPHWHSSVYGMMVATGWLLAAAALATLCAMAMPASEDAHPPKLLHDLGNLLLMFVLAWSYLAFMQYLTVWIADLPDETSWYIPRTLTSWEYLAWFLIAFSFVVPFVLLLSRRAKRNRAWLAAIAAMLLFANLCDALWLAVPNFRSGGFALRWTDLCAPLGIGALWLCVYIGQLRAVRLPAALALGTAPTTSTNPTEQAHG
ncbi:MAG: hypothetical protein ACREPY_14395 [Rhodanobacteraceae bacterium]